MSDRESSVPYGYCHCGCGERTKIAAVSRSRYGQVRGEPLRFIDGHHRRKWAHQPEYVIVDAGHSTLCWLWQRNKDRDGYGRQDEWVDGRAKVWAAHRWVYEREIGPIPEGLEIDHLCPNRDCVNPEHLEPVTHAENMRRGKLRRQLLAA